jgi:membrane protease YdiL (CAAX protease family)
MINDNLTVPAIQPPHRLWLTLRVILVLIGFCIMFALVDDAYVRFASAQFPPVDGSTGLATLWGVVSRLHVAIPALMLILWKPRLFGFQMGSIRRHWRLLLIMLVVNCGVIAAYLWLAGGGTPYSGNEWLITEVVTVPLVEEAMWRGIVFSAVLLALRKFHTESTSNTLTVWLVGIAFGLLHFRNAFFGVPIEFAAVQTLNAIVWGVMYGYARAKTKSVYPAMFLHAAMNLVVVLF